MENGLKTALEHYDLVLSSFLSAQEELKVAAQALRRLEVYKSPPKSIRFPLPDERQGKTHKVEIGVPPKKFEGYVTRGNFDDNTLGEIFLEAEKEGSFVRGILDAFAVMFSLALQYGVPLEHVIDKLENSRFEPDGFTRNSDIPHALSVVDYLMKLLKTTYCGENDDGSTG